MASPKKVMKNKRRHKIAKKNLNRTRSLRKKLSTEENNPLLLIKRLSKEIE